MTGPAVSLVTYVWHYVVGRLVYDQLVRPLAHGHGSEAALVLLVAAAAFAIGRATGRVGRGPRGYGRSSRGYGRSSRGRGQ
jgi:hypothetical protein